MNNSQPLLELQQLQCERDGRILFSGLDLVLQSGEIVYLQGPNGSGKTTLLRAISQLFSDYSGTLRWCGEPLAAVRYEFLSQIVFIGHLPGIRKTLSPRENLAFLSHLHSPCAVEHIDAALAEVGLYGYEDMPGFQLSAGQNRRIALARLYLPQAMEAKLWILDEPYTALDSQGIAKLEQHFSHYVQNGGSILLTSHQSPQLAPLRQLSLLDYRPVATVFVDGEAYDG